MREKCVEACLDSLENDLHKNFGGPFGGRTEPRGQHESETLREYKVSPETNLKIRFKAVFRHILSSLRQ